MKKFLEKINEDSATHKPVVMAFGRMNPPTIGHEKLVDKVKQVAKDYNATHHVIISHSVDAKKNPLEAAAKLKHAKRFFPNTNISTSSKEKPTFLQHAAALNQAGHDHLIMVAGSDRIPEYEKKLNQYNGVGPGKLYNFKKIDVKSAGHRDPDAEGAEGMSASKMREHATNNNFGEFKQGIPSHVPEKHARELFRDVRRGMGLNENYNRGLFRAIFVTGGPGSGKDVIIREAINEQKAVELNSVQAYQYLMDKKQLSEKSNDFRREAIRNRGPLIINGPADDHTRLITIKEELEELGYSTAMVFVDTTNEASQSRNEKLTKMIAETVRQEKWELAQTCKEAYRQNFNKFITFNNSSSYDAIEELVHG
jgi:predicted kinase